MAIGGLAIRPKRAVEVSRDILRINQEYGVTSEVMWKTAKRRRDNIYKAYIDLLHSLIEQNMAHLHIRIQPFSEYDHKRSGDNRETDTVSMAFYQILLHRAGRYYGKHCKILVRPDGGNCTSYLPKMMAGLNSEISKHYECEHATIGEITPLHSKAEPLLQLLDITLGAISFCRNGKHDDPEIGQFKKDLAHYAMNKFSVNTSWKSHPIEERNFNIWSVKPKWVKGAAPKS